MVDFRDFLLLLPWPPASPGSALGDSGKMFHGAGRLFALDLLPINSA